MIKGKHIQQAVDGFGPDNFGMCGVGGVGISVLAFIVKTADAHLAHLQVAQSDTQPKPAKEPNFDRPSNLINL